MHSSLYIRYTRDGHASNYQKKINNIEFIFTINSYQAVTPVHKSYVSNKSNCARIALYCAKSMTENFKELYIKIKLYSDYTYIYIEIWLRWARY